MNSKKYLLSLRSPDQGIKHPPFDSVTADLERKLINEKQKMKTVNQLREKDHEYKAFFVCR